MITLRILNLIAWCGVLAYMMPAVASIMRGKTRMRDPNHLIYAAFAVLVIGFNLRWLAVPDSDLMQAGLLCIGIAIAVMTILAARAYGRGDHV